MKTRASFAFLLFSFLAGSILPAQKTWWVDAARGKANNPGTYAQPFKSITTGVSALNNGDTLFVMPGFYSPTKTGEKFPIQVIKQKVRIIGVGGASSVVLDGEGKTPMMLRFQGSASGAKLFGITFRNGSKGWYDGAVYIDGSVPGIEVAGCYFTKVERGIQVRIGSGAKPGNPRVHDNLFVDIYNDGINMWGPSGTFCYNNTVYKTPHLGVMVGGKAVNCTIVNNLTVLCREGVNVDNDPAKPPVSLVESNDAWNNTTNYAGRYGGSAKFPKSNISVDPKFVNPKAGDFRLQPSSPLIGKGWMKNLSLFGGPDFYLGARVFDFNGDGAALVDIGCHEAADVLTSYSGAWAPGRTVTITHKAPATFVVAVDLFGRDVPGLALPGIGTILLDPARLLPFSFVGPGTGNVKLNIPNDPFLQGGIRVFFQTIYLNPKGLVKAGNLQLGIL